jgi:WhiB family redox-sensing transcriptional regulator
VTAATSPWSWRSVAACLGEDSELWYPISHKTRDSQLAIQQAKAICRSCPVQAECLAASDDWGIWAALTEDERRDLRRREGRSETRARDLPDHGTTARYQVHVKRHEPACEPCLQANRLDNQIRYERKEYPRKGFIAQPSGQRRVS